MGWGQMVTVRTWTLILSEAGAVGERRAEEGRERTCVLT